MPSLPSLDSIRMCAVETDPNGVISRETIFEFTQDHDLLTAYYSGGRIRAGHLVGVVTLDHVKFRYAQLDVTGRLDGGHSVCTVKTLPDGRLQIVEYFQWGSRGGVGRNVLEQVESEHQK